MDAYDSTDGPVAPNRLSSFERQLLSVLAADGEQPPAGLASALETDLGEFSALRDVTPTVETYPLAEAETAYDRMMANDARFRVVLEP